MLNQNLISMPNKPQSKKRNHFSMMRSQKFILPIHYRSINEYILKRHYTIYSEFIDNSSNVIKNFQVDVALAQKVEGEVPDQSCRIFYYEGNDSNVYLNELKKPESISFVQVQRCTSQN